MQICNTTAFTLPADEENLPCGNCTDGAYRDPSTSQCEYCPSGQYSNSTLGDVCISCPAGTAAIKEFAVTHVCPLVKYFFARTNTNVSLTTGLSVQPLTVMAIAQTKDGCFTLHIWIRALDMVILSTLGSSSMLP